MTGLPDGTGRCAGVVVEWAQRGGWTARVAYVVDDDGQAVLVEAWVPAHHLEPALPS